MKSTCAKLAARNSSDVKMNESRITTTRRVSASGSASVNSSIALLVPGTATSDLVNSAGKLASVA